MEAVEKGPFSLAFLERRPEVHLAVAGLDVVSSVCSVVYHGRVPPAPLKPGDIKWFAVLGVWLLLRMPAKSTSTDVSPRPSWLQGFFEGYALRSNFRRFAAAEYCPSTATTCDPLLVDPLSVTVRAGPALPTTADAGLAGSVQDGNHDQQGHQGGRAPSLGGGHNT